MYFPLIVLFSLISSFNGIDKSAVSQQDSMYFMPEEGVPHEGTWLQRPHQFQYGIEYRNSLDPT
jgi:agmatine deiminase